MNRQVVRSSCHVELNTSNSNASRKTMRGWALCDEIFPFSPIGGGYTAARHPFLYTWVNTDLIRRECGKTTLLWEGSA